MTGYVSFGTAGTIDPRAAAVKALGEALQLQVVLAQFDDPGGPVAHAATQAALTTDDIASCGLHVARVLVPGCDSNGAAGLPFLAGTQPAACLESSGHGPRAFPLPH